MRLKDAHLELNRERILRLSSLKNVLKAVEEGKSYVLMAISFYKVFYVIIIRYSIILLLQSLSNY